MRMDGGWERSVGEVAIWRLTTHFTFRDFIPRTNKLPIYTTPIRLCNGQEKKCPREGKKCCIRVHELNRMELSLGKRKSYSKKAKKMGKRNGENERIWVHTDDSEYDRTLRPQGLFHGLYFTNKPQPEKNTNRETERRATQRKKISLALQCFLNAFFSV